MPKDYRVHVFVDFWNYVLSMKGIQSNFKTDWKKLPKILTREAVALVDPTAQAIYSGMNVYGSYDKAKPSDASLHRWATNTLDGFPGVNAYFKPRTKVKSFPICPICHSQHAQCTSCKADMRGTEEKGVDTRIATDLIHYAWEGAYDIAVLVSADQDFVPAAEILQSKGIKVIHAGFHPAGMLLRQKCWASIEIPTFMHEFPM